MFLATIRLIRVLLTKLFIMEVAKKVKLLSFNTPQQMEMVLYDLIKNHDEDNLIRLIKEQCYPVSAFVLNLLLDFKMEHLILKSIEYCEYMNNNVYNWLCVYLGKSKAEDLLCKMLNESSLLEKISEEALVRNQKWNVLIRLEKWDVLQANNKWDLLYEQVTKHGLSVNYLVGGFDYIIEQKNQVLLFQMMCHSSEFIVFYDVFSKLYKEKPQLGDDFDKLLFRKVSACDELFEKLLDDEFYALINMCGRFDFLAKRGKAEHIDFNDMFQYLLGVDVADVFVIIAEQEQWDLLLKYKDKIFELKNSSCEQLNGVCRKLWWKSLGQKLNYFRKKAVE